jgi:hypothetical protein
MQLHYRMLPRLPRLAWLADVSADRRDVHILHGRGVECRATWMVEGVWDAPFADGDFHRRVHFFGSGLRVAGDRLWFVPSCALVDRLLTCEWRGRRVVSNSLVLLLAYTGAALDPEHDYRAEAFAIRSGIRSYNRRFIVRHPEIAAFEQVFHERLVVSAEETVRIARDPDPPIRTYVGYREHLLETLQAIRDNYLSTDRRIPLTAVATVSSGYDSPAVAALVRTIGVDRCFTCRRSNNHTPRWISRVAADDDGTPVARALGMRPEVVSARGASSDQELYFLSGTAGPHSLAFQPMTRALALRFQGSVLFTGFEGDYVWDAQCFPDYVNDEITGNDTSGLGFTEIRLKTGIIHVPVPFLYARRIADLVAISTSVEMTPWRGRDPAYDRPIARRLAEDAGVPRSAFGIRKKAVVQTTAYPRYRPLRRAFFAHLKATIGRGAGFVYAWSLLNRLAFVIVRSAHLLRRAWGGSPPPTPQLFFWKHYDLPLMLHRWAVATLTARLRDVLQTAGYPIDRVDPHAPALHTDR